MLNELVEWVVSLDRDMAFLFALPFIVAVAGLIAYVVEERRARRSSQPQTYGAAATHHRQVWNS